MSEGDEVSIYYDPMISKLAVWGRNRAEAIDRLGRALDEYAVGGIKTTLPFFREIVRDEEFLSGRLDTGFISRFYERQGERAKPDDGAQTSTPQQDVAIIAAALAYARTQHLASPSHQTTQWSKWKLQGRMAGLSREPGKKRL